MFCKPVSAVLLLMVASSGIAQVQIVESQPIGGKSTTQNRPVAAVDAGAQSELYNQLQLLQQEVQELRGLVEQQSFELRQLKQQRMDDYLDLDRRFSQLSGGSGGASAAAASSSSAVASQDPAQFAPVDAVQADELAVYRRAIDLVLKQKDFDGGAEALQKYLRDFPSGHYSANALYWLGQIYLQKNDVNQSQKWFKQMIEQYPTHQKTPEAKLKLAKVYHAQGDTAQARKLLDEVANSGSPAAGLAKEFLQQNF
jgi:tol-pal system protein YbgF